MPLNPLSVLQKLATKKPVVKTAEQLLPAMEQRVGGALVVPQVAEQLPANLTEQALKTPITRRGFLSKTAKSAVANAAEVSPLTAIAKKLAPEPLAKQVVKTRFGEQALRDAVSKLAPEEGSVHADWLLNPYPYKWLESLASPLRTQYVHNVESLFGKPEHADPELLRLHFSGTEVNDPELAARLEKLAQRRNVGLDQVISDYERLSLADEASELLPSKTQLDQYNATELKSNLDIDALRDFVKSSTGPNTSAVKPVRQPKRDPNKPEITESYLKNREPELIEKFGDFKTKIDPNDTVTLQRLINTLGIPHFQFPPSVMQRYADLNVDLTYLDHWNTEERFVKELTDLLPAIERGEQALPNRMAFIQKRGPPVYKGGWPQENTYAPLSLDELRALGLKLPPGYFRGGLTQIKKAAYG